MINQTDIMTTLAYLMGERTIPSTGTEPRTDFIQRTLEEVYRAYPWTFANTNATLAVSSNTATLGATYDNQHKLYVYFYSGDKQIPLEEINIGDSDLYVDGDRKFWVEKTGDNTTLIKTKDTDVTQLIANYQTLPPDINATIATPFSDRMTLALGAKRYIKLAEDPNADISQDEQMFKNRLAENIAVVQTSRPLKKFRKIYEANRYRLGEN